jgi:hypothetical protein
MDEKNCGKKLCLFISIYILANMPVREKKNYQAFMQNDDVNSTYIRMFYPFIIYFMMTVISII